MNKDMIMASTVNAAWLVRLWCKEKPDVCPGAVHFHPHSIDGGASGRIADSNYDAIGEWYIIGCNLHIRVSKDVAYRPTLNFISAKGQ